MKYFTNCDMTKISDSTIKRLSLYLRILEEFRTDERDTVSSDELAVKSGATSAQVRKDLSLFGSFGKRGLGYPVQELTTRIEQIMGLQRDYRVILIGAGKLGSALVQYPGFSQHGFRVVAAYDTAPDRVGCDLNGITIRSDSLLDEDLAREPADIAILTTPSEVAQAIADRIVALGISAILNFTNTKLTVPDGVSVKDVNMAVELEALSFAIRNRKDES